MKIATRIILEGLSNTRDLGGFVTVDGRHVKEKKLIRSGTLMKATPSDIKRLLEEYQLKTVVDFRTQIEIRQCPDPQMQGVTFVINPILQEKMLGITHEDEPVSEEQKEKNPLDMLMNYKELAGKDVESMISKLYEVLVSDEYAIGQYRKFFDCLLNQKEGAILWHCTAGKDRVGVGTALLLSALGVDRTQIIEDYVKTNEYVKAENDMLAEAAKAAGIKGELLEGIALIGGVSECYIEAAFQAMEKQCKTVDDFLEQVVKLPVSKLVQLREMYLE